MKKAPPVTTNVKSQFKDWAAPKRGSANPEVMTNDVWVWLIESNAWPHKAHELLGSGQKKTPGWCFSRYGQTKTHLPCGLTVFIGGEHEDFYDEDFYIYNDVIAKSPDGSITIYGYPEDVFPPTDGHSATLVGDTIYIIGCLGYPKQRQSDFTPVYILDVSNFSIKPFKTCGSPPSWLFKHTARLTDDGKSIICTGGELIQPTSGECVENIADWRLCLHSGEWSKIAERNWIRWALAREDDSPNELYGICELERVNRTGRVNEFAAHYAEEFSKRNHSPDFELFKRRYAPPVPHETLPEEEENFRTHRISIDGVVVRFVEDSYRVFATVEGRLPPATISALKKHGIETFSKLEGVSYKLIEF